MQHIVDARQNRRRQPCVPLPTRRAVRGNEEVSNLLARRGREAVTRNEHETRDEAPVRLAEHEQASLAALLQVQDAHRELEQGISVDLEEVVARIRVEDLREVL